MSFRGVIPDFQLANPLYAGAQVSFYTVDENGVPTTTLATLYANPTGPTTVNNPQTLDGYGKFAAPVYIEVPVIGQVVGTTVGSHSTGQINPRGTWRGDWTTATTYYVDDFIVDPSVDGGNLYVARQDFVSGASVSADVTAGNLELVLGGGAMFAADWAQKTDGTVNDSGYSAKEFAQGSQAGTGGSAKNWAQQTAADVTGAAVNSRSAKSWAQDDNTGDTLGGSAKDWAQTTGKAVITGAYAAKEWAVGVFTRGMAGLGSAKDWALYTGGTVDDSGYSAKEFAQGSQAGTGGSAKNWAQQTGADVTGAAANSRSSKSWAQDNLAGATLGGSAKDWAQSSSLPDGVNKSAKSYAADASTSAASAATSATNAAVSETNAANSAAIAQGAYNWNKLGVDCVTTNGLPAYTYANGTAGVGATITANANGAWSSANSDGVTPTVNVTRIMVRPVDAAAASDAGPYLFTQIGDGTHPFILTRVTDADTAAELDRAGFEVKGGTVWKGVGFVQNLAAASITMGTTALNFSPFPLSSVTPSYAQTLTDLDLAGKIIRGQSDETRPKNIVNAVRRWYDSPLRSRDPRPGRIFYTDSLGRLTSWYNPHTPSDVQGVAPNAPQRTFLYARYDAEAQRRWGVPNILRLYLDASAGIATNAHLQQYVGTRDLAAAGIVPGPSTLISIEATWLTQTLINIPGAQMHTYFYLIYDDNDEFSWTNTGNQVRFRDALTTVDANFMGNGDAFWSTGHTAQTLSDDGYRAGYIHNGIPLPATYGGHNFKGLYIEVFANSLTSSPAITQFEVPRLVVVKGSSVSNTQTYLNWPEDYRPDTAESQERSVNLRNVDRILVMGDSIGIGTYCMRDKGWVSKLSQRSPYNFENYSTSGANILIRMYELIAGIPLNNNSFLQGNELSQPQRDFGITYALLPVGENDESELTQPDFLKSMRRAIWQLRRRGIEPILQTAWRRFEQTPVLTLLAQECGVQLVDTTDWSRRNTSFTVDSTENKPNPQNTEFFVSHPGTRASSVIADPTKRQLDLLPTPQRALKIYRLRGAVSRSSINNFLFSDIDSLSELWREISIGQTSYLSANDQSYYDNVSGGGPGSVLDSEYLALFGQQAKSSSTVLNRVAFADYALLRFHDEELNAQYVDAITFYIQKYRNGDPAQDLSVWVLADDTSVSTGDYSGHQVFGYTGADPAFDNTTQFTTNLTSTTTFTVVSVNSARKEILCTPKASNLGGINKISGAYPGGAGTITKTAGAGPATFAFTYTTLGTDQTFYDQVDLPPGQWIACTGDGLGNYTVPASAIRYCGGPDITVLAYYASAWNLVNTPEMRWRGRSFARPRKGLDLTLPTFSGTQLLAQPLCDTAAHLASWTITGTVTAHSAVDSVWWDGVTTNDPTTGAQLGGCCVIDGSNYISQSFSYTPNKITTRRMQVVVDARYFPAKYTNFGLGTYPGDSAISDDTLDVAKVTAKLTIGNFVYQQTRRASAWWGQITFEFVLPYLGSGGAQTATLTVKGEDAAFVCSQVQVNAA